MVPGGELRDHLRRRRGGRTTPAPGRPRTARCRPSPRRSTAWTRPSAAATTARVDVVVRTHEGRPFLPRRHRGRLRRLARAASHRRKGPGALLERQGRGRRQGPGRARARISTARCRSTPTAIPSTSATPGRRARSSTCASSRPAPRTPFTTGCKSRRTPATTSRSREAATTASSPGGTRSSPTPASATRKVPGARCRRRYDDGQFIFTGDTSTRLGQPQVHPRPAHHHARRDTKRRCACCRRTRPQPGGRSCSTKDDWMRWNDYGIGLLLQGDLRGAESAFETRDRGGSRRIPTAG